MKGVLLNSPQGDTVLFPEDIMVIVWGTEFARFIMRNGASIHVYNNDLAHEAARKAGLEEETKP